MFRNVTCHECVPTLEHTGTLWIGTRYERTVEYANQNRNALPCVVFKPQFHASLSHEIYLYDSQCERYLESFCERYATTSTLRSRFIGCISDVFHQATISGWWIGTTVNCVLFHEIIHTINELRLICPKGKLCVYDV